MHCIVYIDSVVDHDLIIYLLCVALPKSYPAIFTFVLSLSYFGSNLISVNEIFIRIPLSLRKFLEVPKYFVLST